MLAYKINYIPDLTLSKYQVFADSGVEGMLEAQTQFIRQLHRVALLGNIGIHFFFSYSPERNAGHKINIIIAFSGIDDSSSYKMKIQKVINSSGISNYFNLTECDAKEYLADDFTKMSVMHKKERFLQTSLNNEERFFYIVPNWEMNEDGRLYSMLKMMQSFDTKCCYRVDLYTEDGLEDQIHDSFARPLTYLRNLSTRKVGISELSKIQTEQHDPSADETLRQYEGWLKLVDTNPVFLCRVCAFTNDSQYGQLLLDSAITESIQSGNGCIITESGQFNTMYEIEKFNTYCSDEAPNSLKKWTITFTAEEIASFTRLPILYDGETIELPKETAALHESNGISLGVDVNKYDVKVPLKLLPKHMFVCGVPGSGKTNTMLHIANSLWNHEVKAPDGSRQKAHIPFLVLEPAKREYRELALFDIPELIVFSPSACTNFPMKINPFEFPLGLTLSEHIGKLCQVFEGAFPIAPPAPFILDRAIQKIYENHGWNAKDINTGAKEYPTMTELYNQFEKELQTTNYDSEIQGNIRSVLEMRIGSLLRREMKDMFDVKKSTLAPEEWLERPVIIELEALGEGPANFVTLLLCTLIRETLKANPLKDKEKPIRHVIFIEEAHNLIAAESQVDDPQDSNPKVAATAYIVKMLAEVRALREGIIIADQLPTAMAPEVIKNTNIKLVHRLTSEDDRGLVGSTMSASPLQMENMATYTSGQALITYEKLLRPFEMQVALVPQHGEETPDDETLYSIMCNKPSYKELRVKEENIKFNHLKQKIEDAIIAEKKWIQSLQGKDATNMDIEIFKQWISTNVEALNNLKVLKLGYLHECTMLNDDFIDSDRKNGLHLIIEEIGCNFEKKLQQIALLLRKA